MRGNTDDGELADDRELLDDMNPDSDGDGTLDGQEV